MAEPLPARRVTLTLTAYLAGHLGGFYDMRSSPDGGEPWSIPEFVVDPDSVVDAPPERLTKDDWEEIEGHLTARLGAHRAARLLAVWRRAALEEAGGSDG